MPWYDRVLDTLAAPYEYETGMYFRGRKTYRIKWCGIMTIVMGVFMFLCFLALFWPLFTGGIISAELEVNTFNTPADIPNNSTVPTILGRFFGYKK